MKTGDLEKQFGVSRQTIYNWVDKFDNLFSNEARGIKVKQRAFNSEDYIILATIAELSRDGLGYTAIQNRLAEGYRIEDPTTFTIGYDDGRMVPASVVEQVVDASEVRAALERVTVERDRLIQELDRAHAQLDAKDELLVDMQAKLEAATTKIEALYERLLNAKD